MCSISLTARLSSNSKHFKNAEKIAEKLSEEGLDFKLRIFGEGPAITEFKEAAKSSEKYEILGKVRFNEVPDLLSDCNIDEGKYLTGIKEIKIKEKLKNLTSLAFKNDVFGAPTFVVNDKLFWGQDRLEYALDEYNS